MRFIVRSPFRHGPKRIHHSARPVGKFIGEPPLIAEGRVSASRKPLKVRDPVVRTVGRFLVCRVSCPGVVQRFDSRESRTMTIAALIGHVTAESPGSCCRNWLSHLRNSRPTCCSASDISSTRTTRLRGLFYKQRCHPDRGGSIHQAT